MLITSRDNSLLRQARAVRDGKVDDLIYVEGLRLCEEALQSKLSIQAVIFSEEIVRKEKAAKVIAALEKVADRSGSVSEKLLESISYTKTPQGIVVLATRPEASQQRLTAAARSDSPLLVVLHRINNPVNVGAILRSAEAAGATGAIATVNTSDPFLPKSLRGAMGSAFRLPLWLGPEYAEVIEWSKEALISTVCTAATADTNYTEADWTGPTALILGPESTGFTGDELAAASQVVKIPMQGAVESLNVSVAAGILLYEASRQRHLRK
ncbi:MAG TPA: RNA methyltransferase [Pyrinomonadaceae bacterium]|nr:RNA methyltransferase [Pyrinomonadaceae bacterium]